MAEEAAKMVVGIVEKVAVVHMGEGTMAEGAMVVD